MSLGLDQWGFDHSQNGTYRNMDSRALVAVTGIRHFNDGTGRIKVQYRATRSGQPFGRVFGSDLEVFFARHSKIGAAA